MNTKFDDVFLARWMAGKLTEQELKEFERSEDFMLYSKIAERSKLFDTPEFDSKTSWEKIQKKKTKTNVIKLRRKYSIAIGIAACIAVLIGSFAIIQLFNRQISVNTTVAQMQTAYLPDSTLVQLNAGSSISYNNADWESNRNIQLEGEAYFSVTKGQTFTVTTQTAAVTVVGTKFNVKQRKGIFSVYCTEGTVKVIKDKLNYVLKAGDYIAWTENKLNQQHKSAPNEPSWIHGESSFENIPLQLVLDELQRQYPIKLKSGDIDTEQKYSGSFTHTNLNSALKSICLPLHITFTIHGKEVLLQEK